MKKRFLVWLSKKLKKNNNKDYPQTWYYMPSIKKYPRLRRMLQLICWITKHEPSMTEWGYGGGDKADSWCRWCDKLIEVPKESIYFKFKNSNAKELMALIK